MTYMGAVQLWEAEECTLVTVYMCALNLQPSAVPRKLEEEYLLAAVTGCKGRTECSLQHSCCSMGDRMSISVPFPLVLDVAGDAQQAPLNRKGCSDSSYRSVLVKREHLKHG